MDWLMSLLAAVVVIIALAPIAMLALTFFVLVPLAHFMPAPSMLARSSFECPVTKREVSATFLTSPENDHPADVVECSLFGSGRVTCAKGCLAHAVVGWAPSPMVPRYALLSGDTAAR